MALERDNTAERLARIDKLMAEKQVHSCRSNRSLVSKHPYMVVSLPQGPSARCRSDATAHS